MRNFAAWTITAALAPTAIVASAGAQMQDVEPTLVVVTADAAALRCGWGSTEWYAVGEAPRGAMLVADGREGDWLRVRYPEALELSVLVPVEQVEVDRDAGTATLTRPSRPLYRKHDASPGESWMKLRVEPYPPGTEFELIEVVEDPSGRSEGWAAVAPPEEVRAYVNGAFTRDATAQERDAFGFDAPGQDDGQADQPAESRDERPAEDDATPDQDQPDEAEASPQDADGEAADQPADDETDADGAAPADGEAGEGEDGDERAGEEEPVERGPASLEQLEAAFDALNTEPIETAEIDPLIGEYRRALRAAGDDPADETLRATLRARIELLEIRKELQDSLLAVEDASERARRGGRAVGRMVERWRADPAYEAVGRLMASTIYDGRRLPLMFRLQSLDTAGGRTIAYILPDEELDLEGKLGAIVGVVGEPRRDRTIEARIIDPDRVDTLEAAP